MFKDLRSFVLFLEKSGELKRITVPVDPELEVTEIACRAVKEGGPALLFENVKGASLPLLLNTFGTARRIELALGRPPGEIGRRIKGLADDMMPPRLSALWKHRGLISEGRHMRPRRLARAPVMETTEPADLSSFPILKCWPDDGGRFITYPLVITSNPASGRGNLGIYRMHVYDKSHTGMHWQIQKGGGFHYAEAEKEGRSLPVAAVLGADPISMLAAVFPLPEDIDELSFAGFLRGASTTYAKLSNGLSVPAEAEIVLEGAVKPFERRTEGPFGDHFGHYSNAAPFPVFEIQKVHRRRDAIYPAAVVGKPPQEDKYLGNAVQEMFLPILRVLKPELADLWTYYEAGFHNLAVAAVRQRYNKEAYKTAFGLLGEGQMSLTKCLILVDPGVNVRSFPEVLDALRNNFDPAEDFMLLPGTAQDTLDFTGPSMNLGSKMILDATRHHGRHETESARSGDNPGRKMDGVSASRNWRDAVLVVQTEGPGRDIVDRLVKEPALKNFKLIVAVSEDVPLDDEELLIWGIFTRFDCARDLLPARAEMRSGWPRYEGPLGFDATWKEGYPRALAMEAGIIEKVSRRWNEYGIF